MQNKGIIINNIADLYVIEDIENNKIYKCKARGKFKEQNITLVVGDYVCYSVLNEKNEEAVIDQILDRRTYIKRPKMANLTQIVFVVSMKMPKPDLLLLDKQLAFAELNNINSIICFNKIDLERDSYVAELESIYSKIGYTVVKTNAQLGTGIEELKKVLKNNITAFSGNSGVGKSTLINGIFNNELTKEGDISKKNKRGKNTTTNTHLYKIDKDTYIADTPGFSTFDISEIESNDLYKYFKELKEHEKNCEFVGCTHIKEQNCGIKIAVDSGEISKSRYDNFCKIYLDLKEKESHKW